MIEAVLGVLLLLILVSLFIPALAAFRIPGGIIGLILVVALVWVLVGGGGGSS